MSKYYVQFTPNLSDFWHKSDYPDLNRKLSNTKDGTLLHSGCQMGQICEFPLFKMFKNCQIAKFDTIPANQGTPGTK